MAEVVGPNEMHRVVVLCYVYDPITYEFLILRRIETHREFPGMWTVPGGGLSQKDYTDLPVVGVAWPNVLEIALRRECREEAGVEIGEPRMFGNLAFRRKDNVFVVCIKFVAPLASPRNEVRIETEDFTAGAWIRDADIANYPLIGDKGNDICLLSRELRVRGQLTG